MGSKRRTALLFAEPQREVLVGLRGAAGETELETDAWAEQAQVGDRPHLPQQDWILWLILQGEWDMSPMWLGCGQGHSRNTEPAELSLASEA